MYYSLWKKLIPQKFMKHLGLLYKSRIQGSQDSVHDQFTDKSK